MPFGAPPPHQAWGPAGFPATCTGPAEVPTSGEARVRGQAQLLDPDYPRPSWSGPSHPTTRPSPALRQLPPRVPLSPRVSPRKRPGRPLQGSPLRSCCRTKVRPAGTQSLLPVASDTAAAPGCGVETHGHARRGCGIFTSSNRTSASASVTASLSASTCRRVPAPASKSTVASASASRLRQHLRHGCVGVGHQRLLLCPLLPMSMSVSTSASAPAPAPPPPSEPASELTFASRSTSATASSVCVCACA